MSATTTATRVALCPLNPGAQDFGFDEFPDVAIRVLNCNSESDAAEQAQRFLDYLASHDATVEGGVA